MNKYPWRPPAVLLTSALLLAGWLLLCRSATASSHLQILRYVAADGNCGTHSPCYATLQAAVDAANDGDELRVAAGRYTGVSSRNGTTQLVHLDKSIAIRGGYHPQTWVPNPELNPTILDAEGQGRVLSINGNISPTVEGFHLVNGSAGFGGGVHVDRAALNLSHNQIYGNHAEGWGGGVYLLNSPATIVSNHIYTNTTGASGRGGGLALTNSPATLDSNIIEDNRAHVGGGVEMSNSQGKSGARLTGNSIRDNVAFDYEEDGRTFDGAGGGLNLGSFLTDTLKHNVISGNHAKWGGGVHAFSAFAIFADNTIQENEAPIHGGGLYIQGGQISLENNEILSNTADSWGGGLTLLVKIALVRGNTFRGNTAGWRGGGMYAQSAAQFDSNRFLGNTAIEQGGGAFLIRDSGAIYQNSVFVGNQAKEGGGLYLWATDASLIHSTIANNSSGDGHAVVIDKYPGLVDPGAATIYTATVVFSNTIVAGQPVGIFATPDNRLTVDGVLWHATPTHIQAAGVDLTVLNEYSGDPMFQADGYHLRTYSAARNKVASALEHDVDGQLRDGGNQKDLGADEHVPTTLIDPEIGGTLTYTNPQEEVTITLTVPPGAISREITLMFSPFPPLPPEVMDSPFGKFAIFGPPFRLDPFLLKTTLPVTDPVDPPIEDVSDISDAVIFEHFPAHIVAEVGLEKLKRYHKSMERLELQLMAMVSAPNPPWNPACGPVQRDLEKRTLDVPICDTGIISGTSPSAVRLPVRLMAVDSKSGSGYFMFVVEIEETKIFLPLTFR